jgi:CHAT domain-containing protein/tetratricopeptide (TPR) repeat protein
VDAAQLAEAWIQAARAGGGAPFLLEQDPPDGALIETLKAAVDNLAHTAPSEAVERARELAAYADRSGDPAHSAVARICLGNALLWSERYDDAIRAYDEAEHIAHEAGNTILAARCGIGKIGALLRLSRYSDALALADAIQPVLAADAGSRLLAARVDGQAAVVLRHLGDYPAALARYDRAAATAREVGEVGTADLATVLTNQGFLLATMGRRREAIPVLEWARDAAARAGRPLAAARAEGALGHAHLRSGRYTRALHHFDRAADLFEGAGLAGEGAVFRSCSLECWLYLGHARRVQFEGPQILERAGPHLSSSEAGVLRYLLGLAYRRTGERDRACECLEEALRRFESAGRGEWAVRARLALVGLHIQSGQLTVAEHVLRQAQTALVAMEDTVGQGRAHLIASDLHRAAGRPGEAVRAARRAWRGGRRIHLDWLAAAAHRRLADLNPGRRRLWHLLCGARAAERVLGAIPADLRSGYFAETRALFEGAAASMCEAGETERAWETVQRAKARGMAEIVAGVAPVRLAARSPADEPLVAEINRLLDTHRRAAHRSEFHPDAETGVAADVANTIQDMMWQLQVHNAAYAEEASLLGTTWKPQRPAVDQRTALIEWFCIGDEVSAFVLTTDGVRVIREVASVARLHTRLGLLNLSMRAYAAGKSADERAQRTAWRALEHLGGVLLEPLRDAIAGRSRLIVAPHGLLHGVPFHALVVGGEPVWNSYEVSYVPSGAVLSLLRGRRGHTRSRPVVVADTLGGKLPEVQREAEEIGALLGAEVLVSPTKDAFLAALADAGAVHVAAHCRFDRDVPLLSAIHLTGGPVAAADLLDTRTPAALVVCSGCETAAHRVLAGDELMGFARAWFHAGVTSLVLSLWPVADVSARQLMRRFYERLLAGASTPTALRHAALSLWEDGYAHPLHWAPFIFVGEPDTRPIGSQQTEVVR